MAVMVFVLLALIAVSGWRAEADEAGPAGLKNTARRGEANPSSENCPKGLRYKLKCNWCNCDPWVLGVDVCSYRHCADWDCKSELDSLAFHESCFGHCECNPNTNYTMCELKGCPR